MKRWLVIPLMFIYILAVSGVMIHAHYCGDDLESWTINTKTVGCDDGACGNEQQKSDGCCKDKVISAKVASDQHITDVLKLKLYSFADAIIVRQFNEYTGVCLSVDNLFTKAYRSNAPPGNWQQIPLYKLLSSFTYYG